MKYTKEEIQDAKDFLKTLLKNNNYKIGIIITKVSKTGMSRKMRVYCGDFQNITYLVAKVCDLPCNENGLKVDGCGMDMTFWLADTITYCLYGKEKPEGLKGNGGGCIEWGVL